MCKSEGEEGIKNQRKSAKKIFSLHLHGAHSTHLNKPASVFDEIL
jgi:hypothetical protein